MKVDVNTSLAVIWYKKKYPEEVNKADQLSKEDFELSEELKMGWRNGLKAQSLTHLQEEVHM